MNKPPGMDGLLPTLPSTAATPLCHLPPPEVTFSRAPSCSHPSQPRSQLHRPGRALLKLPSPRCVLVTLFYGFPRRAQPLFKPSGKTLKSLSLKTKAPGAALTGRGNGELITHPEHSLGCSHSAQAHPQPRHQEAAKAQDAARSSSGAGLELGTLGQAGGKFSFHEKPFASLLSQHTQSSPRRSSVCVMTFSCALCGLCRTKQSPSLTAALGSSTAVLHLRTHLRVWALFGHYLGIVWALFGQCFAGTVSSGAD